MFIRGLFGFRPAVSPTIPPMTPTVWPPKHVETPLAVLISGGLDSAILLGEAARAYMRVVPIFLRVGSLWETVEENHLRRFLKALNAPTVKDLVVLEQPVRDVYGSHWSMTGQGVPGAETKDEAVFLPGRNMLLLAKPLLWCHLNGVPAVAMGPLGSNPFPDATPEFFADMAAVVNRAVEGRVRVLTPYADMNLHKADVLRRGRGMPLEHTFSCMNPHDGRHCGRCNKCEERRRGFREAGMADPTPYPMG
jgi:7-cyano-7-deazaguanine synthase